MHPFSKVFHQNFIEGYYMIRQQKVLAIFPCLDPVES